MREGWLGCAALSALIAMGCASGAAGPEGGPAVARAAEESLRAAPAPDSSHSLPPAAEAPADLAPAPATSFVPGEALITAAAFPDAASLDAALPEVRVVSFEHQFGQVYLVRFVRRDGSPADAALTERMVSALKRVEGIRSSEPNSMAGAR